MHQSASPHESAPPVPAHGPRPGTGAGPEPAGCHSAPRLKWWDSLWYNRALRATMLVLLLSLSGLVILALVRERTGTEGFLVGLGLAVLPVPLLITAFRWLDRVEPKPWRNLIFAFAWGACAATLVALLANTFATEWLMSTVHGSSAADHQADADAWGATFVAPVVEESAKGSAVALIFLFRRRDFNGITDGVVIAGITATGFAFTENILYLGSAFVNDQDAGYSGLRSITAATFFIRVIMSPFAHPLFTAMTGIGFGLAAAATARQRVRRVLIPIAALLTAMVMHGLWNGSATLGGFAFLAVYALFMVPVFGLLTWLAVWSRGNELRTVRTYLPIYQAAGWITPPEPLALSSMRARGIARDLARRTRGSAAARVVAEYTASATSLAFLRQRAHRGTVGADFTTREQVLLHQLWQRREVAQPVLAHAALSVPRPRLPMPPHWGAPLAHGRWPQPYPGPFPAGARFPVHPYAPSATGGYAPGATGPYAPGATGPYGPGATGPYGPGLAGGYAPGAAGPQVPPLTAPPAGPAAGPGR
ncbi:hypothetical protein ACZ90_50885 [Streptomyces albus subsp. albus]|nr:hypothetical protein ACZ90_50885 [Streptomyces albus subsp. albus]